MLPLLILCAALLCMLCGAIVLWRDHEGTDRRDSDSVSTAAQDPYGGADGGSRQKGGPLQAAARSALIQAEETLNRAADAAGQLQREKYLRILDRGMGDSYTPASETERSVWEEVRARRKEELQEDPYLILVNQQHQLPEDYEADPVTLPNGQSIDRDCYEPLLQMLEDCAAAGGTPIVCSGYRPHWYQENLFDAQISRWLYAGYGQEDAEALAATAVAIPGTSEHELGFAADIYSSENMDLDESQIYTVTQQWPMENSWRYGFILRYPQDRSSITGIIFEPWHYRYVGKEHAQKIYEAGICLEEYLDEAGDTETGTVSQ